jgi:hypothetical protein
MGKDFQVSEHQSSLELCDLKVWSLFRERHKAKPVDKLAESSAAAWIPCQEDFIEHACFRFQGLGYEGAVSFW